MARNSPLPMATVPSSCSPRCQKVPFGFIRKGEKLLCPALENHAVLGENDIVVAAAKQLYAQLLFQIGDLAGKGRLCHMQLLRGPGEVFFPAMARK